MFYNCQKLTAINGIENWDTSKVTTMQSLFHRCYDLTSLNLSNWNTSNVTNMNYLFYDCKNLITLDISNFDTSKLTNIYTNTFSSCKNLNSIKMNCCSADTINDIVSVLMTKTKDNFGIIDLMNNKHIKGTNYDAAKNKYWKIYYRSDNRPFTKNISNKDTVAVSNKKRITRC